MPRKSLEELDAKAPAETTAPGRGRGHRTDAG